MSAPVMAPPVEAEQLDRLEAEILRSPSSIWPQPSPTTPGAVELPVRADEQLYGPEAWWTRYRTYGLCCR